MIETARRSAATFEVIDLNTGTSGLRLTEAPFVRVGAVQAKDVIPCGPISIFALAIRANRRGIKMEYAGNEMSN